MNGTRTVGVLVSGRVQGVSYREWTRREALARGLSGHVRNRADGRVEALFSGPPEAVEAMLDACRTGPPAARVADVAVEERGQAPAGAGFEIEG